MTVWRRSTSWAPALVGAAVACTAMIGCGGAAKSGATSEPGRAASEVADGGTGADGSVAQADDDAAETSRLPTKCASSSDELCLPPERFVKRLCEGDYPTVALLLFSGKAPWTHGYLTRNTRAWNASGGGASDEELRFDEEVVILRHRRPSSPGGIVVSGAGGGYDALRWNGACVTLTAEELTLREPPRAKNSRIIWPRLESDMRDALRADEKVDEAYRKWRKHCKGVTVGRVSKPCVRADATLAVETARFVREGGALAEPEFVP